MLDPIYVTPPFFSVLPRPLRSRQGDLSHLRVQERCQIIVYFVSCFIPEKPSVSQQHAHRQSRSSLLSRSQPGEKLGLCALIVEDEPAVGDIVQLLAEECGFRCYRARSSEDAEGILGGIIPDLILLDLRLPGKSGQEFLASFRSQGGDAPVIVISGVSDVLVRIEVFGAGADGYFVKPFVIEEVKSRIRTVMRRTGTQRYLWRNDGHLRLDPATCTATYKDRRVSLTPHQFGIVWILAACHNRLVSIEELSIQVLGDADPETIANCHTHISKARTTLRQMGSDVQIRCTIEAGYSLVISEDTRPS